tara:strand:- start:1425 stop:1730 length:306 start_codon:yes stop_codon:yes gene_type:complete
VFFANGKTKGSKSTRIEQWQAIERISGKRPQELQKQPYLEDHLLPVWDAYCLISKGVENISLTDILAYCTLYDEKLDRWQVDAILGLDQERLKQWQTQLQD